MMVNKGYVSAKVVSISDGRSSALSTLPYITSDKQVGISLSGAKADEFKSLVSVGSTIEFRCDMTIEGEDTKPIYTQCSSMFELMKNGLDNCRLSRLIMILQQGILVWFLSSARTRRLSGLCRRMEDRIGFLAESVIAR